MTRTFLLNEYSKSVSPVRIKIKINKTFQGKVPFEPNKTGFTSSFGCQKIINGVFVRDTFVIATDN